MRNLICIISGLLVISSIHHAQLTVKDQESSPNTLLQVVDEGNSGSIFLPPVASNLTGTKLYNYGGNLFWGSNQLGLAGTAGGWTDSGTLVYTTSSSDRVAIGTIPALALLSVGRDDASRDAIYCKTTGYGLRGINAIASGEGGVGVSGYGSNMGDSQNYGGYFEAAGRLGRGVYGHALNTNNSVNYGGYFEAKGRYGRGVLGSCPSIDGIGVYGTASGTSGIGIYGLAENNGLVTNYGGYFEASGSFGRGIYCQATNSGDETNYGGYLVANGKRGRGVYGKAQYSGNETNYGGYFEALGETGQGVYASSTGSEGCGVYGLATSSGNSVNYGGYFEAQAEKGYGVWGEVTNSSGVNYGGHFSTASTSGRAVRGHATNTFGENYGGAFRADGHEGRAVWAFGQAYDYYAAGPGTNYGSSSSRRWKENIREIDNPVEKLLNLRGVYFDWDEEHGGKHDVGCIAEEVGKVLPEIVVYEENGIDAEGMDYSKLTPLLVEVAKAQQHMIKELESQILELMKIVGKEKFSKLE